jgi:hypothetical protein
MHWNEWYPNLESTLEVYVGIESISMLNLTRSYSVKKVNRVSCVRADDHHAGSYNFFYMFVFLLSISHSSMRLMMSMSLKMTLQRCNCMIQLRAQLILNMHVCRTPIPLNIRRHLSKPILSAGVALLKVKAQAYLLAQYY